MGSVAALCVLVVVWAVASVPFVEGATVAACADIVTPLAEYQQTLVCNTTLSCQGSTNLTGGFRPGLGGSLDDPITLLGQELGAFAAKVGAEAADCIGQHTKAPPAVCKRGLDARPVMLR